MDTAAVLQLLVDVADEFVNPRFRALAAGEVDEKKPGDFVTIADRESEAALTRSLQAAYPDALILGEEATFADPTLLQALAVAEHAFVVDPVDGTANFVRGSADHAVMVGELINGEPVRGWIWQPQHEVSWVAEKGAGVRRNGEPVRRSREPGRLAGRSSIRRVIGATGDGLTEPVQPTWWCCGVDYPRLFEGGFDFIVYGPPKPWDHVPGALMLRELAGVVRVPDGNDYRAAKTDRRLVAAMDDDAWVAAERVAAGVLDY